MRTNVGIIHFFEPVGGGAEWSLNNGIKPMIPALISYLIVNHRQAQVGVIQVEVERDAPHDNQTD